MVVLVIIFVVVLLVAFKAVVIVPNDHVYVTERMGRYAGILHPGLNFIMPLVDTIRFKHPMMEQTGELSDVFETQDRKQARLTSAYRFRIVDPQRASYGSVDYTNFLKEVVRMSEKKYVGGQTWDALREDTRSLEAELQRSVDEASEPIGVKVLGYEVKDLQLV